MIERLTRLKATWPAPVWEWDPRFAAIASSFETTLEPQVRASAVLAFPRGWTAKSIDTAPPEFRELATRTGLRAGQRLLGGDPLACASLFGLWWPWGSGDKVTLRIGLLTGDVAPIRELFGVHDRA